MKFQEYPENSTFSPGLQSLCRRRKESEVFGWNRSTITTPWIGVGFFCPTPTPEIELNHFLYHTPNLGIPLEMVQFLLKPLLKQKIFAEYHNFH